MAADNTIDIIINQKASFEVIFNIKQDGAALKLTNYTTDAKLKTNFTTPDNQAIAFTTAVVNAAAGSVSMTMTPAQTANLNIQRYFYDFSITSPANFKTRIAEGVVKVSGGVS